MPQYFDYNDSYPSVSIVGPNLVAEVQEIGFYTKPSHVYGRVAVPREDWLTDDYVRYVDPMAQGIEAVMDDDRVVAMYFEQDVNEAGQLVDNMVVVVQAQPTVAGTTGPFRGEVRAPTYAFAGQARDVFVWPPIAAEYQRLVGLAG